MDEIGDEGRLARKKRLEGLFLLVIGLCFVLAGVGIFLTGNPILGILGVFFFGPCVGLGLFQSFRPLAAHPPGCFVFLGCVSWLIAGAATLYGYFSGIDFLGRRQGGALLIGVLLTGGALLGLLLWALGVVGRMQRRRR